MPDIVFINHSEKLVRIIEVSVPFDAFVDQCYNEKLEKYFPLSQEINGLGYRTEIIVFIIGSLGSVHKRFAPGLKIIGFPRREVKFLPQYLSVSALVGSYNAWIQLSPV